MNSCFWELTRRCRLECLFCRTKDTGGAKDELSLSQNLKIADQLIETGVRTVVLTGGEPTMYRGWADLAERLTAAGVVVRLFTSGFEFSRDTLRTAKGAGITEFALSLDGPQEIHDRLRPAENHEAISSFDRAMEALGLLRDSQRKFRVVTQVNAINVDALSTLYELLKKHSVPRWQVHLCQISGRARENRDQLLLPPASLETVVGVLLLAAREKKVLAPLHCTMGYMTKEEPILRARGTKGRPVWSGCRAGKRSVAITPSGHVKGCTALIDEFSRGSVVEQRLLKIWQEDTHFPYRRNWSGEVLGGQCVKCAFAAICQAGCPAVAYGATGSIGTNPYCLKTIRGA